MDGRAGCGVPIPIPPPARPLLPQASSRTQGRPVSLQREATELQLADASQLGQCTAAPVSNSVPQIEHPGGTFCKTRVAVSHGKILGWCQVSPSVQLLRCKSSPAPLPPPPSSSSEAVDGPGHAMQGHMVLEPAGAWGRPVGWPAPVTRALPDNKDPAIRRNSYRSLAPQPSSLLQFHLLGHSSISEAF